MWRTYILTIFLICLMIPLSVRAAEAPAPMTRRNGLRVVVRERHTSPLVAIDLWVRAGSREEREGENGCAHYLEHTLFKGTKERGQGAVDFDLENLGGVLNAATGMDYAHFYTVIPQGKLEAALQILADVVRNATLPEAEIERERGVILDELAQRAAEPDDVLFAALYRNAFRTHPYRFSPGGTPEAIRGRQREALRAFYRRTYTPERCVLALVGDLTPERAKEAAGKAFGDWPRAEIKDETPEVKEPEAAASAQEIRLPTLQARVGLAFRAPAALEAEDSCLSLLTMALLGSFGEGGRFGAAQWAGTGAVSLYACRKDPSLLLVTAALPIPVPPRPFTAPIPPVFADATALQTALTKTLQALCDGPLSAAEVAAAKRRLLGKMLFDEETVASWARTVGYAECVGSETPEAMRTRLEKVTPEQLQSFVRLLLDPAHAVIVRLLPEERAADSSQAQGATSEAFVCGGAPPAADPPRRVLLDNGTRLLLKPEPESEEVAIQLFIRQETPRTPGEAALHALVAKALFYGSLNRTYDSIVGTVAKLGGHLISRSTPDYALLTCVTNEALLREATSLLCEAIKNAEFTPEALERARLLLLREQQQRQEETFNFAYDSLCHAVRGTVEPDAVALRHVTQEQALAYFRRTFTPANTVITVVGRFDAAKAQQSFANNLVDYDRTLSAKPAPKSPSAWPDALALTFPGKGSAAYALLALPAPPVTSPDYPAFMVLTTLLGNGHASRLFRHIRDEMGLGYNLGAFYQSENADPLIAYLEWDTRRAARTPAPGFEEGGPAKSPTPEEALKLLQAQVDGLRKDPPTEAEVTRARNLAVGRYALRHERVKDRAFLLGWYEIMGVGAAFDASLSNRLAAVTREDLLRLAGTYLTHRATATTTPPPLR